MDARLWNIVPQPFIIQLTLSDDEGREDAICANQPFGRKMNGMIGQSFARAQGFFCSVNAQEQKVTRNELILKGIEVMPCRYRLTM